MIRHRQVVNARPFKPEIVFEVDDTDAAYRALVQAGTVFTLGPLDLPDGTRAAFLKAPDGNVLKLGARASR